MERGFKRVRRINLKHSKPVADLLRARPPERPDRPADEPHRIDEDALAHWERVRRQLAA